MDCEFKRVDVWPMTRGGTSICWQLGQDVHFNEPYHFYVDFGQPATDEWLTLNAEPIVDDCCYTDICQRTWSDLNTGYYRVRLVLPSAPGMPVYKSQPAPSSGHMDRKDWLIARDIMRREYLQQRKVDGTQGFLLKRKQFGMACPRCLDWDTKEVRDSDCPVCYGTGFVGGYYPGVEYWITGVPGKNRRIDAGSPPRGNSSDMVNQPPRCILYPQIDTRDIWIQANSDERWIIDGYSVISEYRGVPLIAGVKLKLAPATDIVYSVGIEPVSSSSSQSTTEVSKGLDDPYEEW